MPERNAVEVSKHGDQIGPYCPEDDAKQRHHHQHGNTQRLLVNLLKGDGRLLLRLRALGPLFHQILPTGQRTAVGDASRRHAKPAQHRLVEQVPNNHQIDGFNPAAGEAQRGVEVAGRRQHHQRHRHNREYRHGQQAQGMGLFIAPAVAAHRPHQNAYYQQIQEDHNLPGDVVHQMQRRQLGDHRPEVQRQQRQTDADNLTTPVAGQLRRHREVGDRDAVFLQHLPAHAEYQPEERQLFTEGP